MSPWALNHFVHAVSRGAIFGYPTDTVWGLGCHPLIASSVSRILQIKNRSPDKGLILLSSRIEYCSDYLGVETDELESNRLPGKQPTTWLVTASEFCPPWIHGIYPTVGIRITSHPLIQSICDGLQAPIVSTSANRSGKATARTSFQMRKQFGSELDFIVNGFATGSHQPSEIKSLTSGTILRTRS
jgi:L-threonylcarbamoyladenylate synthase